MSRIICDNRDIFFYSNREYINMDLRDEIRIWIKYSLDMQGRGSRKRLADFLRVSPDQITRMLNTDPNKETRAIKADELVKIREFFGGIPEKLNINFDGQGRQKLLELFERSSPPIKAAIVAFAEALVSQEKNE